MYISKTFVKIIFSLTLSLGCAAVTRNAKVQNYD